MPRKVTKQDPIKKKAKPESNPIKSDRLAELKAKLEEVNKKLKLDKDNKKLLEVKKNLEQMFEREHERGYC